MNNNFSLLEVLPQAGAGYLLSQCDAGYLLSQCDAGYLLSQCDAGYQPPQGATGCLPPEGTKGYSTPLGTACYPPSQGAASSSAIYKPGEEGRLHPPPPGLLGNFLGYAHVGFKKVILLPPVFDELSPVEPLYRTHAVSNVMLVMGQVARSALNAKGVASGTGQISEQSGEQEELCASRPCGSCVSGKNRCLLCSGTKRMQCSTCGGKKSLRLYIELKIKWTNHLDHIVQKTPLPEELIKTVKGNIALEETYPRVWPVNHFPEDEINRKCTNLLNDHKSNFPRERILKQRQIVELVPVTLVTYKYKNQNSSFFVYGMEHRVYAPNYPDKCCCGCSVI